MRVAIFGMMALSWLLVFNSCKQGEKQLRYDLKEMMSSDIVLPADDLSPDVFVLVSPYSCRECQEDQSVVLSEFISETSEKIAGYVYRHGNREIYEKLDSELLGSIVYFILSEGKVSSLSVANRLFPDITLTYLEKIMNRH